MSDEKTPEATEEKKKNPMIKVIILVVVFLLVVAIAVLGTLFATGAFSPKKEMAHDEPEEHGSTHSEKPGAHGNAHGEKKSASHSDKKSDDHGKKGGGKGDPQKKQIPKDVDARFEKSYMELDDKKPLVANVAGSRKVMQVSLSIMTQYDDRVFANVEKHRAALRSVALDILRQVTEADLAKPDFRSELAKQLRVKINSELTRLENFGGIEEVFFTEFVHQ